MNMGNSSGMEKSHTNDFQNPLGNIPRGNPEQVQMNSSTGVPNVMGQQMNQNPQLNGPPAMERVPSN